MSDNTMGIMEVINETENYADFPLSSEVDNPKFSLTPREIVAVLDKYIIGQDDAKRAMAIALRTRWRRMNITDTDMQNEVIPKNILMIGPTGVGKTEIARRLAKLTGAPFIKIEATKFTEVGYVGSDVESIIRHLMDIAMKEQRAIAVKNVQEKAYEAAKERVLDRLVPKARDKFAGEPSEKIEEDSTARRAFRKQLDAGYLDEEEIEFDATVTTNVEIMTPPNMQEMASHLEGLFQTFGAQKTRKRRMKIKEALKVLRDDEAAKLINEEEIKAKALFSVEQNGIVFIDEIDKVTKRGSDSRGADVSREGVQRDLLSIIEGCSVSTKYGMVKTDHILFMGSGSFHLSKPSDLIPELQGRLPIRVELNALTASDFVRILKEPEASLIKQYTALLATENVNLEFNEDAILKLAEAAWKVNDKMENIGARRLHTILERLLNVISFEAPERGGETIVIDAPYVEKHLGQIIQDIDLARYIL